MSTSAQLLDSATPHGHLVQLYGADPGLLVHNVTQYFAEGLRRGDSIVIVATPAHLETFMHELAVPGEDLESGRVTLLDAQATLDKFMVDGLPDATRFDQTVGTLVREIAARSGDRGIRAYGEMVGILWEAQEYPAAIHLERLWNELLRTVDFNLFCGYPIDVFGKDFQIGPLDDLLCAHTHLLPTGDNGRLQHAVDRSMDRVLGSKVTQLRPLMKANHRPAWASVPGAEATILWLRNNLPNHADEIMTLARQYYESPSP